MSIIPTPAVPSVAMFTTDPKGSLDTFEKTMSEKITSDGDAFIADNVTGRFDSMVGDALKWVGDMVPFGILDLKADRCINVPDFSTRFSFSLPSLTLAIGELPCGLDDKINEFLDSAEDKMSLKSFSKDLNGDIISHLKGSDSMEIQSNQKVLHSFITTPKPLTPVADDQMATATAGGLMRQSTRFGLHDNIKLLMENSPPTVDLDQLQTYLLGSMRRALDAGELNTINACTDVTGGAALLSIYPDAISAILKGYTISELLKEHEYTAEAVKLIDCLDRIDPDWDRYQSLPKFNDQGTVSGYGCDTNTVTPFISIGKDAKTLLAINERTMVSISVLPMVQSMEIKSAVILYYPEAGI